MHPYARLNLVDPHRTSDLVQYLFNQPPAQNEDWYLTIDLVHDNNNSITLTSSLSMEILWGFHGVWVEKSHVWLFCSSHHPSPPPEIYTWDLQGHSVIQPAQPMIQPTDFLLPEYFCLPPRNHLPFICVIDFPKSANRVNYCIPLSQEVMYLQKGRLYNYQMHPNAI